MSITTPITAVPRSLIPSPANASVIPALSSASPFSQFDVNLIRSPVTQKQKNTEFGQGYGKGFLTVLSMPWHGALMTLGIAGVGIALPWTVPFITLGVFGLACYQAYNALSQKDWGKMGQSLFALLSPLMGGRWLRHSFSTEWRELSTYALKQASAPKNPSKNIIKRWFQDSKASLDDSLRLLTGEKLQHTTNPKQALSIYQIAGEHLKDSVTLGFLKNRESLPAGKSKTAIWRDRLLSARAKAIFLEMLSVALTPGGPPNGFGMELTQSDREQQIEKYGQPSKKPSAASIQK